MIPGCLLLALLALPQSGDGLTRLLHLAEQWLDAVNLYRDGDVDAAVRALDALTPADQERVRGYVFPALQAIREGGVKARPAGFRWQIADLSAAAALHMEAALAGSRGDDEAAAIARVVNNVTAADRLFEKLAELGGDASSRPKWLLAAGLAMTAEGAFQPARRVLGPACEQFPSAFDLQLACGSLRESMAIKAPTIRFGPQPGLGRHIGVPPGNPLAYLDQQAAEGFLLVKHEWEASLEQAHASLVRALQIEPGNLEAQLRLAHVEMLEQKDASAAARLEPIVAKAADPRVAYLARLFLSDIRARANARDRAVTLLEEAVRLVPSGQAAHVALAQLARDGGDYERTAVLIHRMMNAPVKPDDPWLAYRFGQYWVPGPLLASLRAEAQTRR